MEPLEDRLRDALRDERWRLTPRPDALTRIHAGAARRRHRRAATVVAAVSVLVAGAAGGVGYVVTNTPTSTVAGGAESAPMLSENAESDGPHADAGPGSSPPDDASAPNGSTGEPSTPSVSPMLAAAPVPGGFTAVSFTAASAERFWLLGTTPSGAASVATTTDGGASFTAWPMPARVARGENDRTAATVRDLRVAAGGRDGWAYGGALWATHDAGRTWTRVTTVPGLVERLEVGADAAYAVVRDGDRPALWRTPVDEDAWRRLPLPALDSAVVDVGGLAAVGDTVALTVRSDVETFALVSTDAGATFAARPTPCAADLDAGEVSAVRGALWLACPTGTALTVHVSTDAGVSWSALPATRPALSDTAAELGARSRGEAVVAVPGEAVAVGRAGTSTTKVPGLGDPAFAGFTTERVGYILDLSGGLFRTTDGGASWRLVEVR